MGFIETLTAGHIRFTFYSDSLVRIEHSPSRFFREWPTAVVENRSPAGAEVRQEHSGCELVVKTPRLEIHCEPDSPHLTRDNMRVQWQMGSEIRVWRLGDVDDLNLGGTRKSLDGVGAGKLPQTSNGVLSRARYFVLYDNASPTLDTEVGSLYPQKEHDYHDLYFLSYEDFPSALEALAELTGRIPMIPKYALGLWFSRYYAYTAQDYMQIARAFNDAGMPLDVMVLDVDWHKYGWEGFDWNTDLIPDPAELVDWLRRNGMRVGLNVHPGGVPPQDSRAPVVRHALGIAGSEHIKLNLADPTSAKAYMELLHRPVMEAGVDFWWIDGDAACADGLDSQNWTNRVYFDFARSSSQSRPMVLSRYGGFGSQKYPIGFSGDTKSDWAALKYEVSFSSRAGNALMPYWSHDIGGFSGNLLDPELYVRWFQFGALSPFLRLHSDHGSRAPWEYPDKAQAAAKKAFELKTSLTPFVYSLCHETYAKSLPVMRPLYLTWPEDEECYAASSQYTLGDALMVCTVVYPAAQGNAHVDVYLPEGVWHDYTTGTLYQGGRTITYSAPLDRIPIFARSGAIVPTQLPSQRPSTVCPDPLIVHIYAGAHGDFTLYEDDGETQSYEMGEFASMHFSLYQTSKGIGFAVDKTQNRFPGWKSERGFEIRLHGATTPTRVLMDGIEIKPRIDSHTGEVCVSCRMDLIKGAEVLFEGSSATAVTCEPGPKLLEVSAAMLQAEGGKLPRLVVSAISANEDYEKVSLSAIAPEGWNLRPVKDARPGHCSFELGIPASQPPGVYVIQATASLASDGKTLHDDAHLDWHYASVTDFQIMGTFPNPNNAGMQIAYGPETDFGFHPHHDGHAWHALKHHAIVGDIMPIRYVDLTHHFGPIGDVVAYALTYIHTDGPREVRFDLGSDDGMIAWLNAKEILRAPEPGPAAPAQHRVGVLLHAGWNQVMLKIGQLFGDWGFYFEVRTSEGEPAEGLRISRTAM